MREHQWEAYLTEDVYRNLVSVARALVKFESQALRDQAEDLVNQTLLAFVRTPPETTFQNEKHFCAFATVAMRRCLIDLIRSAKALKRGYDVTERYVEEEEPAGSSDSISGHIAARQFLASLHRRKGRRPALVLEMRALKSASMKEIATELELSIRTVKRDLAAARDWASSELELRRRVA